MPPFDFPNSPTAGQQVTGAGSQVYTFDGQKWTASGGGLNQATADARYVNVSGDTMAGDLVLAADPTASMQAANKHYVDNAINLAGNYLGTWQVAANTPSVTAGGSIANANYVAVTANPAVAETAPVGIPGIAGQSINNGDRIIWASGLSVWQILRSAGLGVASFNTRTGAVTLTNTDVVTVLPASSTTPVMDGVAAIGSGTTWAKADHIHPVDTSRAAASALSNYLPLSGGSITGATTFNVGLTVGAPGVVYGTGNPGIFLGVTGGWPLGPILNATVTGQPIAPLLVSTTSTGAFTATPNIALSGATSEVFAWYSSADSVKWSITFSDRRFKASIEPAAKDALAAINALAVYEFDLTPPLPGGVTQHWNWGLMADEVETIPSASIAAMDKGYASLRELPLIAALVRSVQQLSEQIAALRSADL